METNKAYKLGFVLLMFLLLSPILYLVLQAIAANSEFPFTLFMDERITYEPINKAHKGGIADRLGFVFDGQDNRYGRLLWNMNYVLSALPFGLWGDSAQVISVRLVQTFTMIAAFLVLIFQLIRSPWLRLLSCLCLLLLPSSFYYYLMPKPEPQILLCLALLVYSVRKEKYEWMLIATGVLAGLKISMLPFCLFLIWIYIKKHKTGAIDFMKNLRKDLSLLINTKSILIFLGFSLVVYFLLDAYLIRYHTEKIYMALSAKQKMGLQLYFVFLLGNSVFAGLIALFIFTRASKKYKEFSILSRIILSLTSGFTICNPFMLFTPYNLGFFLTTSVTHGLDRQNIGFADWMKYCYKYYFFSNTYLVVVLIMAFLAAVLLFIRHNKLINKTWFLSPGFVIFIVFLINAIPVVFFTKRLWGFYLHIPVVFLILFFAVLLDRVIDKGGRLPALILATTFLFYAVVAVPQFKAVLKENITKQDQTEFKQKVNEYKRVCSFIQTRLKQGSQIYWDPNLFSPDGLDNMDVKLFWGPFNHWDKGRELVVFSKLPDDLYRPNPSIKNSEKIDQALKLYLENTDLIKGSYTEIAKDSFPNYKLFAKKH